MNKKIITKIVFGLVITSMSFNILPTKIVQSEGIDPGTGIPVPGNMLPHADAGGPYYGTTQAAIQVDGSGSHDHDGTVVGWCWDWTGDGTWDTDWLTIPTASHLYSSAGAYTLKLKVKDNEGGVSMADSTIVYVNGINTIDIQVYDVFPWFWRAGNPVEFYVAVQNRAGPEIYWYDIDFSVWLDLNPPELYDDDLNPIHFESIDNPLETYHETTYYYTTIDPDSYVMKGIVTCGSGTDESTDTFIVFRKLE